MKKTACQLFRFRFSLKALLFLPFLVALFFALSSVTKFYGTGHVKQWLRENRNGGGVVYKGPLLFAQGQAKFTTMNTIETTDRLYLWLFGPVFELPWQFKYVDQIDDKNYMNSMNDILKRRLHGK